MPATPRLPPDYFSYELPPDLIAQDPTVNRGDSNLLWVDPGTGCLSRYTFRDLPSLLSRGDLLVFNDSRVIAARLQTHRVASGGRVELLLVRPEAGPPPGSWLALARPVRRLRRGSCLAVIDPTDGATTSVELRVRTVGEDGFVSVMADRELETVAAEYGEVPLPPYIKRRDEDPAHAQRQERDRRRYQTVYARQPGSVAAPTAGLHFEQSLLQNLEERGIGTAWVTLHIGPGTFRPPSEAQMASRRLHAETFHYPAATDTALHRVREGSGRVIAVGTTSLRVLETVRRLLGDKDQSDHLPATRRSVGELHWSPQAGESHPLFTGRARRRTAGWEVSGTTRLFIQPPDNIQAAAGLVTNFHLPGSSLLMLVAAMAPEPLWREAYLHAVNQRFRFYSYGDAMLILASRES